MALTYHPDIEVVSGVPLVINGVLLDATGQPLDVTNCTLSWGLLDPDGNPVVPLAASISKTDAANGAIGIEVSEAYTALAPGRYTDALEVTEGLNIELFRILVAANPFNVR